MSRSATKTPCRVGTAIRWSSCILIGIILLLSSPAAGIWLPWTSDQARIERIANEVWQALILKDHKTLKTHLWGAGAPNFIRQEMDLIKNLRIEEYECSVKKLQFDTVTGKLALVVLEKIATQESGQQIKRTEMSVFRIIGGRWRLVVDLPKRKRELEDLDDLDEEPATNENDLAVSFGRSRVGGSNPAGPVMNVPESR